MRSSPVDSRGPGAGTKGSKVEGSVFFLHLESPPLHYGVRAYLNTHIIRDMDGIFWNPEESAERLMTV